MVIPVIDTHVHLDELPDPEAAIEEARQAGLAGIVAVGMDLASNRKTLELSQKHPGFVFPALGYHPWKITLSGIRENLEFIQSHLDQAVALGEIGLDYKVQVARELQHLVFQDLLETAWKNQKPVIVHSRLSHETTLEMVRKHALTQAVFHWYSGPLDTLKELLLLGYFISATPALAYSPKHREAVATAPLKQILIETDAPVRFQGEESRPAHVLRTLTEISRIKGLEVEEAALRTTQNARDFFGIV